MTINVKWTPLEYPMGKDCTCCIHNNECNILRDTITDTEDRIKFRCPFIVEVSIDTHYCCEDDNKI